MDPAALIGVTLGGFASIITAVAGLAAVVYRGNKKAREERATALAEVEDLQRKVLQAQGLIYRLRQVLVAHGWMDDPDLVGAQPDVVAAAQSGESR